MLHGFRIYVVEAFKNRKKDREPEITAIGSSTALEVLGLIESAADAGTQFFYPPPVAEDSEEPQKRVQSITVRNFRLVRDGLAHFVVSHGEQGERPHATKPGSPEQDIEEWSAEGAHFMTVIFSTDDEESRFVVVAQSVRSRDALRLLVRLLQRISAEEKKTKLEVQEAEREIAKAAGEKPAPRSAFHRLIFDHHQAVDNAYLDEILVKAKSAKAIFESRVPGSRGDNHRVRRALQINLLDEKDREISSVVGRRWSGARRRGEATTQADGVSELAGELVEGDLMEDGEAQEYNHAAVAVRSESGASTTIAVDTLRDVFTYPVSDGPPSAYQHYKKVEPRLEIVAAEEGVELEALNALEIDQCLQD